MTNYAAQYLFFGNDLLDLPADTAAARAGKSLGWSVDGTALENKDEVDLSSYLPSDGTAPLTGSLEVRNGATPVAISTYGSYTDASNYERVRAYGQMGGNFRLAVEAAGTGVQRALEVDVGATHRGRFGPLGASEVGYTSHHRTTSGYSFVDGYPAIYGSGSAIWQWTNVGDFVPSASGIRDIGSATKLVDNIYANTYHGDGSNLTGVEGTDFTQPLELGDSGVTDGELRFNLASNANQKGMLRASTYGCTLWSGVNSDWDTFEAIELGLGGLTFRNAGRLQWSSTGGASGVTDLELRRDAADSMAQYRGANPQSYALYGTHTDASNYERIRSYAQTGGNYVIDVEAEGTGVQRGLEIGRASSVTGRLIFSSNGDTSFAHASNTDWFNLERDRFFAVGTANGTNAKQLTGGAAEVLFTPSSTARTPLAVGGIAGQAADLFKIRDDWTSNGTDILNVAPDGQVSLHRTSNQLKLGPGQFGYDWTFGAVANRFQMTGYANSNLAFYTFTGMEGLSIRGTRELAYGIAPTTGGHADVRLYRDGANQWAMRNATNANSLAIYGTYTDSNNYERLRMYGQTGGDLVIASEAAGTGIRRSLKLDSSTVLVGDLNSATLALGGTSHSIRHSSGGVVLRGNGTDGVKVIANELQLLPSAITAANLPTADPVVAGRLWNDGGNLKVSAG